jgi:hypothetical protein
LRVRSKNFLFLAGAVLAFAPSAAAQTTGATKLYRGAIGSNHIQMALTFNGNNITGKYSYDRVGEEISVKGTLEPGGNLLLTEFGAKNKPTAKFSCKKWLVDPIDRECYWSRPDGSGESFVSLNEQSITLTGGLKITPRMITNRIKGVTVSYPQLESTGELSAAATKFNRRMVALTQKAIAGFEPVDGKGSFDTNYNVLLATNDLVSIEMTEYADAGAAHPNNRWWALTYDLAANQELKFTDLFKPDSDYNTALARYITADIDRRADELEKENARRENRAAVKREDSVVPVEDLSEVTDWGITPKGVVIYFDLPHVIAYFDKNFVPFSAVKEYLKPDGPAARFCNANC